MKSFKHFGLKEGSGAGHAAANFVRCEFTPKDGNFADVVSYSLKIDESETPLWLTDELLESVINTMREIISKMIVTDERELLLGGKWILAEKANVKEAISANIHVMRDSSQVGTMRESSHVGTMLDSSQVGEKHN